jgi:hypothetical protein
MVRPRYEFELSANIALDEALYYTGICQGGDVISNGRYT